jgi:hypothetical protein
MTPLYCKVFPRGLPLDTLRAKLGAFDLNDLEEKDRGKPETVAKAHREHDAALRKRSFNDPAYGLVGAIAYRDHDGTFTLEMGDEKAMLEDFWRRYRRHAGDIAGWDIFDVDLHWILVRSWACKVEVPAAAKRNAGNGRIAWIGFTDLKRELAGGPGRELDLDRVLKAFGWEGEKAKRATTGERLFAAPPDNPDAVKARADAEDDLRQLHDLAVRMGLESPDFEKMPPLLGQAEAEAPRGPSTLDVETEPGQLARLKEICGEFDPAKVKTGQAKKPEKIQALIDKARASYDEDLLTESMLDPFLGRTCAIGCRRANGEIDIPEAGEKEMLEWFWARTERGEHFNGWNLFHFDLHWLIVRSLLLNVRIPARVRTRAGTGYVRYRGFTDLMREFTGSPREYASVQTACDAFGLPGKNGKGDDFHKLWNSSDPALHEKGRGYLTNDLEQEAAIAGFMGFDHGPDERLDRLEEELGLGAREATIGEPRPFTEEIA